MKRWRLFFRKIGWPAWVLFVFTWIFVLLPLLFNRNNIVEFRESGISFPAFSSVSSSSVVAGDDPVWKIPALIPYSPGSMDTAAQGFLPPLGLPDKVQKPMGLMERHWLGTDLYGRDILTMVIYAARSSLSLAAAAALLSWLTGLLLGTAAAYFTCFGWHLRIHQVLFGVFSFFFLIIVSQMPLPPSERLMLGSGILLLQLILSLLASNFISFSAHSLEIGKATIFMFDRVVEFFAIVPRVVFVLVILPLFKPSASTFILILVLSSWVDMARIVRAETSRVLTAPFVESARMSGISSSRLLWRHVLPNIWPATLVHLVLSVASNIMMESGVEFLGFGWAKSSPGLGDMIAVGKHHVEVWWIVLFPGLLVATLVYSLFSFSTRLQDMLYQE